ncbi:MAG TPA: hypothetical protein PKL15_08795 [Saprospiraceae bacterium]|nr:hypothetical protein [Saprospiraceae bacterium]
MNRKTPVRQYWRNGVQFKFLAANWQEAAGAASGGKDKNCSEPLIVQKRSVENDRFANYGQQANVCRFLINQQGGSGIFFGKTHLFLHH